MRLVGDAEVRLAFYRQEWTQGKCLALLEDS